MMQSTPSGSAGERVHHTYATPLDLRQLSRETTAPKKSVFQPGEMREGVVWLRG
jgi:hypothetical protein